MYVAAPTLEGCRERLRLLTAGLRVGVADKMLVDYLAGFRRGELYLDMVEMLRFADQWHNDHRGLSISRETLPEERPKKEILLYLANSGLGEQVAAYISRFRRFHFGDLAAACEHLQVKVFNENDLFSYFWSENSFTLPPRGYLNYFRVAQRFRDENGCTREDSPVNCFRSFEDIVKLERQIERKDFMDFLLQCIALELLDATHDAQIYTLARSRSQLQRLHLSIKRPQLDFSLYYHPDKYRIFFKKIDGGQLTLNEYSAHLRCLSVLASKDRAIFDRNFDDGEVNQRLNCLLNNLLRTTEAMRFYFLGEDVSILLNALLRRGASLNFKDPDEKRTSLGALVEFANRVTDRDELSDFSAFCCCPLNFTGPSVVIDNHRISRLSCLAARMLPTSTDKLRIPETIRHFAEAHQDLQSQMGPEKPVWFFRPSRLSPWQFYELFP